MIDKYFEEISLDPLKYKYKKEPFIEVRFDIHHFIMGLATSVLKEKIDVILKIIKDINEDYWK